MLEHDPPAWVTRLKILTILLLIEDHDCDMTTDATLHSGYIPVMEYLWNMYTYRAEVELMGIMKQQKGP